ncbi:MAG: amino acid ABC transporter permease [Lachnospiraceae bacterium]|mgnify:CR=1 FL=1|jgi:His/Glu/Gln/Arg/opine family amino acid ABC transporter permease subunit|uniref:amino acid ABC transporter permease n=1 Tax=Porcincola TaxID=2815778 RepID=UPI002977F5FD|nr:amino acid ABC transporter permease [Porcincola intestinalis]MCI6699461.1 amino acid ABC transporter permease [Lachnospiraceae bacterium]MCI7092707.1 amino acid ABC transporter permease [Lachnospiraceae bacterium]MDD6438932.1 amino acid ABC transporter permease [Lachnospiraceae bacterium]MDY4203984.1 amino acid ABC transporter permease [Porcincola intestinalis]MDY5578971.1 amino acid ABC transporter permease [Porcincola intestinalis]
MNWLKSIGEAFYNAWVPEKRYLAYLSGLRMTLLISLFAVILGILIGILIAVTRVSSRHTKSPVVKFLNKLAVLYVTVIRGTPMIVQILIIYNLIFTSPNTNPVIVGAVCCGINSGAYVAEIIRAGIESIPIGQMEAGRSLGMPYRMTMTTIILPQAIRNILPALGNEFISLIKETSVISIIAVNDLTKMAGYVGSRTWDVIPPYVIAALFYLAMTLGLSKILSMVEHRMEKGTRK